MQALCAYESVALGTSEFCNLFTPTEWEDFTYANDLGKLIMLVTASLLKNSLLNIIIASLAEFWYSSSFGNPDAPALGAGWAEELVELCLIVKPCQTIFLMLMTVNNLMNQLARLTRISPTQSMTSINLTLDANPVTFPLDQNIYVDATHDTVLTAVIVALNLTSLAQSGPLPTHRRLEPRSFTSTHIVP